MWKLMHILSFVGVFTLLKVGITNGETKFISTRKTWREAVMTCEMEGGSLLNDFGKVNSDPKEMTIWTGGYEILKWKIIWGCYKLKSIKYYIPNMDISTCQSVCLDFNFFSVKKRRCFCLHKDMIGGIQSYHQCHEQDYYTVFKHDLKIESQAISNSNEPQGNCLLAVCVGGIARPYSDHCSEAHRVICDSDGPEVDPNYVSVIYNFTSSKCKQADSFIKWIANVCGHMNSYYWASGSRQLFKTIANQKDISTIRPKRCLKSSWNATTLLWMDEYIQCSIRLHFYCTYDSTAAAITTTSPSVTMTTGKAATQNGTEFQTSLNRISSQSIVKIVVVVGVVVLVILVTVIVLVVVFMRKRSRKNGKKKALTTIPLVYSTANSDQVQQRPVSNGNQLYDDINDGFLKLSNGTILSPNHEVAIHDNKTKAGTSHLCTRKEKQHVRKLRLCATNSC